MIGACPPIAVQLQLKYCAWATAVEMQLTGGSSRCAAAHYGSASPCDNAELRIRLRGNRTHR
jgi:hypothetical protein